MTAPKGFQHPKMMKKPRFWWRIHASPRTMDVCSDSFQSTPLPAGLSIPYKSVPWSALGGLPNWFLLACFFIGYLGVVRRKGWPHFFRFHVVSGMLLLILLQAFGIVRKWLPSGSYWGKIGIHFWMVLAFGYLFPVMECIRCAISGQYKKI